MRIKDWLQVSESRPVYAEMKYLYDNGFKVLTMSNLKYNQNTNSLYLGDVPGITVEAAAS